MDQGTWHERGARPADPSGPRGARLLVRLDGEHPDLGRHGSLPGRVARVERSFALLVRSSGVPRLDAVSRPGRPVSASRHRGHFGGIRPS